MKVKKKQYNIKLTVEKEITVRMLFRWLLLPAPPYLPLSPP